MMTYIKHGSNLAGPFTLIDLKFQVRAARVTPLTPASLDELNGWTTLGKLHPELFPKDQLQDSTTAPTLDTTISDPEIKGKLTALYTPLLGQMENRWGATARPGKTFYAHRAITNLIQRVRIDLLDGGHLNHQGMIYLTRLSAFIASVVVDNWERRGLAVKGEINFGKEPQQNKIRLWVERKRDNQVEIYGHDFLKDTFNALLKPRQMFPYMHDRFYAMESLTLPSPEYLYLFGTSFMSSPLSFGNWPRGETVGCLKSDFEQSRNILIDDLHHDCQLPKDHEGFRKLSWWFVFPPYGWDMNDGGDYNMMTFFSQVFEHEIVSLEESIEYLRALLTCQGMEIRNLAARCLMVLRVGPRNATESSHYKNALLFRDHPQASSAMQKYQHQIEGVEPTPQWVAEVNEQRQSWLIQTPPLFSLRTAAEQDPAYQAMEKQPPDLESGIQTLETLIHKYPDDWVLKVIHASQLLQGVNIEKGEANLKELIVDPPDCFEAHSRYGTWLKYADGRREEAFKIYEDALKRWPWCQQASDACIWMLTDGLVDR